MTKKVCNHKEFWPLYKALNAGRFEKEKTFVCKCGKTVHYDFFGNEEIRKSWFLSAFSAFLWSAPAIAAILISAMIGWLCPVVFLYAVIFVVAYHFVGMYYVIKSPMLQVHEEKKSLFKGLFK